MEGDLNNQSNEKGQSQILNQNVKFHKDIRGSQLKQIFKKRRSQILAVLEKESLEEKIDSPGKKVAAEQKIILSEENFLSVFDPDQLASLDINWEIYQDVDNFDTVAKRLAMPAIDKFINKAMDSQKYKNRQRFLKLFKQITDLKDKQNNAHSRRIDRIFQAYFMQIYHLADFHPPTPKNNGKQLGNKTKISLESGKDITFYVKTHNDGLLASLKTAAKRVDPLELMIYKILEKIGIGCESHFFGRDLCNFYIATKDAGADGVFMTYDRLKINAGPLKEVWDSFSKKKEGDTLGEIDQPTKNVIDGLISFELLSRILRLSDLLINPGNYGFAKEQETYKAKIVDFGIIDPEEDFRMKDSEFKGWTKGEFNHSFEDHAMRFVFTYWDLVDRKPRALRTKNLFDKLFATFETVIQQSKDEVQSAIVANIYGKNEKGLAQQEILEKRLKEYTDDFEHRLAAYAKDIEANVKYFGEQLNKYFLELKIAPQQIAQSIVYQNKNWLAQSE